MFLFLNAAVRFGLYFCFNSVDHCIYTSTVAPLVKHMDKQQQILHIVLKSLYGFTVAYRCPHLLKFKLRSLRIRHSISRILLRFQHFRKNIQLQHYSCCQRRNQCKRNAADFRTGRNESVLKQTEKNHRKADGNRQRGYFSELCLAGSLGRELADPAYSKADSKNAERREQFAHEHTQIKVVFEKAVIQ